MAEFHYWDFGEFNRTAMDSRPEIRMENLKEIANQFGVDIKVEKISASFFHVMRFGSSIPHYGKVIVRVTGRNVDNIKTCIGRIFIRYGRPDEVPTAFFGSKRLGKAIIDDLINEYLGGKR